MSLSRRIRVLEEKHNMKFRQIGHTTSQYGQSFFPKTISAWNGLGFAEAPSLAVFFLGKEDLFDKSAKFTNIYKRQSTKTLGI